MDASRRSASSFLSSISWLFSVKHGARVVGRHGEEKEKHPAPPLRPPPAAGVLVSTPTKPCAHERVTLELKSHLVEINPPRQSSLQAPEDFSRIRVRPCHAKREAVVDHPMRHLVRGHAEVRVGAEADA